MLIEARGHRAVANVKDSARNAIVAVAKAEGVKTSEVDYWNETHQAHVHRLELNIDSHKAAQILAKAKA